MTRRLLIIVAGVVATLAGCATDQTGRADPDTTVRATTTTTETGVYGWVVRNGDEVGGQVAAVTGLLNDQTTAAQNRDLPELTGVCSRLGHVLDGYRYSDAALDGSVPYEYTRAMDHLQNEARFCAAGQYRASADELGTAVEYIVRLTNLIRVTP